MCRRRRNWKRNLSELDAIQLREAFIQIRLAVLRDLLLIGPGALGRALALTRVQLIHHIDTFYNHADRREATGIQPWVVCQVDEHLSGA